MRGVRVSLIFGLLLLLGASVVTVVSYSDGELTGDEILDRVEEEGDLAAEGSLITIVRFDNAYSDGTTTYSLFGGLSKLVEGQPERTLIYFVEPEDTEGTLFLGIGPVDPEEDTRLFLYLPALGSVKELVSEEQREASFAGSTFSYEDVGGADTEREYEAELLGEAAVTIGETSRSVYLLSLTAKPGADVDYPTGRMWVDKESFIVLRSESYNDLGDLERTMEVLVLGEFEGRVVADELIARDVLEGDSTKITFLERRRPEGEIPDEVFDPENLPDFDPAEWGFAD